MGDLYVLLGLVTLTLAAGRADAQGIRCGILSAGAETVGQPPTSPMNIGQTAVGRATGPFLIMHAGVMPCYALRSTSSDTEPPTMILVQSVAAHDAGEFGIDIDTAPGVRNVEPRSSGIAKVVVMFDEDVQPIGPADIAVVSANGSPVGGIATSMSGTDQLTITFTPALGNGDTYVIAIDAADLAGNALGAGDDDFCIAGLVGDFTGNGVVSAPDKAALVGFVFQTVNGANAKFDVQVGGGAVINVNDVAFWTGFFGQTAPGCP